MQVTRLLEHELTHCLMFQRAGGPPSDPQDRIPFWFREGMATVTAGEGAQWPPPESLSQWLAAHPGVDPLRDARTLARTDPAVAYGAAYHGFDFLVRRYGDATVLRILDRMRALDGFPAGVPGRRRGQRRVVRDGLPAVPELARLSAALRPRP